MAAVAAAAPISAMAPGNTPDGRITVSGEFWWASSQLVPTSAKEGEAVVLPVKNLQPTTPQANPGNGPTSWGKSYGVTGGWGKDYSFMDTTIPDSFRNPGPVEHATFKYATKRVTVDPNTKSLPGGALEEMTAKKLPAIGLTNSHGSSASSMHQSTDTARTSSARKNSKREAKEAKSEVQRFFLESLFAGRVEVINSHAGRGPAAGSALEARALKLPREHRAPIWNRRLGSPLRHKRPHGLRASVG
mmetsp:Transcript_2640/g.2964  ORF Transcript_2640/g.2964 Transcript_2640/m.2964 type:complete len:246 (+) Transcript_2640:131-868(+)